MQTNANNSDSHLVPAADLADGTLKEETPKEDFRDAPPMYAGIELPPGTQGYAG